MANQENPWSDPARESLDPNTQQHQNPNNPYYQTSNSPNPWASNPLQDHAQSQFSPPPGPPPSNPYGSQQQNPFGSDQSQAYPYNPTQNQPQYAPYPDQHASQPNAYPPAQNYAQQSFASPIRASTFEDPSILPPSERGEQREAMEQFELTNPHAPSADDANLEKLQGEFPKLDGSLIAAIYGDSKDMGATREMLGELSRDAR